MKDMGRYIIVMKDMDEVKGVDAVGKVLIPSDIRKRLGIDAGDKLHFYLGEGFLRGGKDTIIIKKEKPVAVDTEEDFYGS